MKFFRQMARIPEDFSLKGIIAVLLALAGTTMVVTGVWMVYEPAGWITGGLALLMFEHRVDMSMSGAKGGGAG